VKDSLALALPTSARPVLESSLILNALMSPVLVVNTDETLLQVNSAAEDFFELSVTHLVGTRLDTLLPADSPLFSLIQQARSSGSALVEYGLVLDNPRVGKHIIDVQVSLLAERPGWVVVALHEQSVAVKMGHQLSHRNSARSVAAMSAMMAHEIKKQLS